MLSTVHDFTVQDITGQTVGLSQFDGKVLLIVNVASRCGFTPQYQGLEQLYRQYADQGFSVLAFPCNQFSGQEPGSSEEIQSFCQSEYDVTFPLFAKIDVNGRQVEPFFQWLKSSCPGIAGSQRIKWNFTKFLVNREGQVVARFSPTTKPSQMQQSIEELL